MDPIRPSGMSLGVFLVSSAMFAMLSKPLYAKYTTATARNTPGTPYGTNGVRLLGFAWKNPATMMNAITSRCTVDATQLTRELPLVLSIAMVAVAAITADAMGSSSS
jgi:hypothetical protein